MHYGFYIFTATLFCLKLTYVTLMEFYNFHKLLDILDFVIDYSHCMSYSSRQIEQ